MRTLLRIALLSWVVLAGRNRCAASDHWETKLSALPANLCQYLVERFDYLKEIRQQRPDFSTPKEEQIITDDPAKYTAGCDMSQGLSRVLFLRAKAVRNDWVIQYEIGGRGTRTEVLVLSPDGSGVFHKAVRAYIGVDKNDADEVATALEAETPDQKSEPTTAPDSPASGQLVRQP